MWTYAIEKLLRTFFNGWMISFWSAVLLIVLYNFLRQAFASLVKGWWHNQTAGTFFNCSMYSHQIHCTPATHAWGTTDCHKTRSNNVTTKLRLILLVYAFEQTSNNKSNVLPIYIPPYITLSLPKTTAVCWQSVQSMTNWGTAAIKFYKIFIGQCQYNSPGCMIFQGT